jgi:hypothetical protein
MDKITTTTTYDDKTQKINGQIGSARFTVVVTAGKSKHGVLNQQQYNNVITLLFICNN